MNADPAVWATAAVTLMNSGILTGIFYRLGNLGARSDAVVDRMNRLERKIEQSKGDTANA